MNLTTIREAINPIEAGAEVEDTTIIIMEGQDVKFVKKLAILQINVTSDLIFTLHLGNKAIRNQVLTWQTFNQIQSNNLSWLKWKILEMTHGIQILEQQTMLLTT